MRCLLILAMFVCSGCASTQISVTPWTHSEDHVLDGCPGVQIIATKKL